MPFLMALLVFLGVELNSNPHFTTNTTGYTSFGNQTISRITSDSFDGVACGEVVASGAVASGNVIRMDSPAAWLVRSYTFRFMAKSVSGNAQLVFGYGSVRPIATVNLSTGWQQYTFRYKPENSLSAINFGLAGAGTCRIDNLSVQYTVVPSFDIFNQ